jgi:hypothetical protein
LKGLDIKNYLSASYIQFRDQRYSLKQKDTSNTVVDTLSNQTDTIFQEKIVEVLRVDTLKVYIPVKPKVETKDTTTAPSLSVSSQSQN